MTIEQRLAELPWRRLEAELDDRGWTTTGPLLNTAERAKLIAAYGDDAQFRSTVVMARHGFGRGEYRYFGYPLPPLVQDLREQLYERLLPVANGWRDALGEPRFPESHAAFLDCCYSAGQTRPTALVLRYGAGDWNNLHQDLYGDWVFPLQAAFLLSQPGKNFSGGEFVLTEQRPRMQSRPYVVPLEAGEAVIFAVNQRPVKGTRGFYRALMRHGVSELRSGSRYTLGIILHDAA